MKTNPTEFLAGMIAPVVALMFAGCEPNVPAPSSPPSPAPAPVPVAQSAPTAPAVEPAPERPGAVLKRIDPALLNLSPGVAEVVKLSQAGVDSSVIAAFVETATNVFNPSLEEVVYMNDMGVPGPVLTALLQRAKETRERLAREADAQAAAMAKAAEAKRAAAAPPPVPIPAPAPVAPEPIPLVAAPPPQTTVIYEVPVSAPVEVTYFYSALQPYGSWLQLPGQGWCWQPGVAATSADWRPYCDRGRWIDSDCGWYWQSDYSWGWAAFHYGRWFRHASHGWVWTPDRTWGPAWVSWRSHENYAGWAPLPPGAHCIAGRGLVYHDRSVGVEFDFGLNSSHFTFVTFDHFAEHNPAQHAIAASAVQGFYPHTRVINNYTVADNVVINRGMPVERIAAASRTEIRHVSVRPVGEANPGTSHFDRLERTGADIVIYRPDLNLTRPLHQPVPVSVPPVNQSTSASHVNAALVSSSSQPGAVPQLVLAHEGTPGNPVAHSTTPALVSAPSPVESAPRFQNQIPTVPQPTTPPPAFHAENPEAGSPANRALLERAGTSGFGAPREFSQPRPPPGSAPVFSSKGIPHPSLTGEPPTAPIAISQPHTPGVPHSAVPVAPGSQAAPIHAAPPSPPPANPASSSPGNLPGGRKQQN